MKNRSTHYSAFNNKSHLWSFVRSRLLYFWKQVSRQ